MIEASHPISEGYATAVPSVAEASHPIPDGYATASAPVVAPFLDPVEHYSHQQNASDEGFGGLRDEILGFLGRPNNPTITDQPTSTPAYPPLATGSNSHGPYFLHALPQEIANTTTNTATTTIAATASKEKSAKRKQDPITRPVEEPHRKGCPCRYCHSERPDDSPTPLSNAKDLIHALGQDTVDKFREMPAPQVQWNSIEERIRRIQRITREVDEKLNHVGIESPAEPKDQRTGSPDYSGPALPTDALYEERAQQTQMRHQALQEQESRLPTEFGMDQLIPGLLSDTVRTEFRMDQLIPGLLSETVPTEFEMDELLPELQSGTIPSEVENAELIPNLPSETTDNAGSIPGLTAETTETPIEFDQSLNAPSTQGGGRDQGDLEPSGEQPTFEDWMDWDWSGCPEWNPFAQDSFFVEGVPGGNEVEMTM